MASRTHASASIRAFSLIETLTVISIISLIAGFCVPSLRGLTSSKGLQTGARQMAGWLNIARSEAIARHTLVRFAVVRDWPGKTEASLRKASLWAWDAEAERFFALTGWQELPQGVVMEPTQPEYLSTGAYAAEDRSALHGDYVLSNEALTAQFDVGTQGQAVLAQFVEFTAAGTARVPGNDDRQAIFVITPGVLNADGTIWRTTNAAGHAANWAQINVDKLTGRVRVYQP